MSRSGVGLCICGHISLTTAGPDDRDGPVMPAVRRSGPEPVAGIGAPGRAPSEGLQRIPPRRQGRSEQLLEWPDPDVTDGKPLGGATSPSPVPPCAHRIAAHGACVLAHARPACATLRATAARPRNLVTACSRGDARLTVPAAP